MFMSSGSLNRRWLCGRPITVPGRLRRTVCVSGGPEVLVWHQGLRTGGTGYLTGRHQYITMYEVNAELLFGSCYQNRVCVHREVLSIWTSVHLLTVQSHKTFHWWGTRRHQLIISVMNNWFNNAKREVNPEYNTQMSGCPITRGSNPDPSQSLSLDEILYQHGPIWKCLKAWKNECGVNE